MWASITRKSIVYSESMRMNHSKNGIYSSKNHLNIGRMARMSLVYQCSIVSLSIISCKSSPLTFGVCKLRRKLMTKIIILFYKKIIQKYFSHLLGRTSAYIYISLCLCSPTYYTMSSNKNKIVI